MFKKILMIVACAFYASSASATTFLISEIDPAQGRSNVGGINFYEAFFNEVTEEFSYTINLDPNSSGDFANLFTFAVNNGPNPKVGDLALAYVDLDSDLFTVYNYNGGRFSYREETGFITSLDDAVTSTFNADGTRTVNISLDATEINSFDGGPNFSGIQFDSLFSQWTHTSFGAEIEYAATGQISSILLGTAGAFIDSANRPTIDGAEVPEPLTLSLLGMGLLGGALKRKKA